MALTQVKTSGIADDAVTLAKQAGGTDGNIISFDASGNPVAIATGNDGQVLTSTGAGSPPAFEDVPAGGATINNATENELVTVASTTSQLDAESGLTFDGSHLQVSAAEGQACKLSLYSDEGDDNADKWHILNDNAFWFENFAAGSWHTSAKFVGNGGQEFYYQNAKKFETTSAGATVTGNLTVSGTMPSIGDSSKYTGNNICLGTNAGLYGSSNYKIAIGVNAGQYGTGRHNNTFIGFHAGRGNSDGTSSTGDNNCCVGNYAGEDLTSAGSNTLIGPNAGKDLTTGGNNVCVGNGTASSAETMEGSVVIGPSSGYGLDESNYSVIIGHGASGETLQGDAADNQLFIARQGYGAQSAGTWIYGNSSGQCQQGGGSASWSTGSDERYKDFLGKYSRGLAAINALDVQNFKWKDKDKMPDIAFNNAGSYCGPTIDGKTKIGIGAQSCEKVIPEAVNKLEPCALDKGGNHMLTLDNDPIFWAMVNAIQELSAKVTALENA